MGIHAVLRFRPRRRLRLPQAAWCMSAALVTLHAPAAAQTVNWNGTTQDWFTGPNWSTGAVPSSTDDVSIDTRIFIPPFVTGPGATSQRLFVGGQIDVGTGLASTGTGMLTITNGGQLVNGAGNFFDTFIGVGTGSIGGLTVNGAGSNWTSTGAVLIGSSGATGSLTLDNGGTAGFGALFVGASLADFTGLTITNGSGPSIGTLTVTGGSRLTSSFFADVGVGRGATGTITVSGAGSALSSDGGALTGVLGGYGTLNILNGGRLTTGLNGPFPFSVIGGGGPSNLGMGPPINGGVGVATISGPRSTWANTGGLYVGGFVDGNSGTLYPGTGTLTIAAGGTMTSTGGVNSGLPDAIGLGAGSLGTAIVTGTNSQWTAAQNAVIGFAGGTGALTVENRGAVDVAGIFGVGVGIGPYLRSTGTLNVLSGGTLVSNSGRLGGDIGSVVGGGDSTGLATVSGAGSAWIVNGGLFVGGQTGLELGPGAGTVNIADGGTVRASSGVTLAPEAGSVGTLNIGAAPGAPPAAPGTLDTSAVIFGNGRGAINFNHTATDDVFAPAISGPGSVNQLAGTTILTGDSTYTNATTISGGILRVNGSLGNTTVTVSSGGTLGGTGSIAGPVTVAGGGLVAPGNSIGTLTLGGKFSQGAGSTYQVELNAAGQSDRLAVGGTATIGSGSTVQVIRQGAAPYVLGTRYTILSAAGGVNGSYSALVGDAPLPFIGLGLSYDPNDVFIDVVRSSLRFADVGLTRNQRATGAAVEALGRGNVLYDTVVAGTANAAQSAFNALSGEAHASAVTAGYGDARLVQGAILNRLRSAAPPPLLFGQGTYNAAYAADLPGVVRQPGSVIVPAFDQRRFALWGDGFGSWGRTRSNGNAASLDTSTGGFILGAEAQLDPAFRVGLAGGFTRTPFEIDGRLSSGSNDSIFGAIYGSGSWGAVNLRLGASYAWHDIDTQRTVVFPGFADAAFASYDGSTLQTFGELGYALSWGRATIEPILGASVLRLHTDGFQENGGAAALTGLGRDHDLATTTLGVRGEMQISQDLPVIAKALIGWRHAYGDVEPSTLLAFAGGASAFVVSGVPVDRNALVVEAGLDWHASDAVSLGVAYAGQIGNDAQNHSLKGSFVWKFATR